MQKHEGVLFLARARAPATSNAARSPEPRFTAVFKGFRTELARADWLQEFPSIYQLANLYWLQGFPGIY